MTRATAVVVVLAVVLGLLGYQHFIRGDQGGLAALRESPYLEPAPRLGRDRPLRDAKRPSFGFVEHRGLIQVVSASPRSERELMDYYASRYVMEGSLTSKPTFRRLKPIRAERAVVMLTDTPPRFTLFDIDVGRVPQGTRTFVFVEVAQSP